MHPGTENHPTMQAAPAPAHIEEKKPPVRRRLILPLAILCLLIAVLAFGIVSRLRDRRTVDKMTAQMAVPSVAVVLPKRTASAQEIVLPGNIQPFVTTPIYSRTNGYLKKWYFDIGAHVKKGQLLAV